MGTAVIGQFLATSLYQAISETLPLRVEFYEAWLTPKGFRAKHVYVAGVRAVLSFLRLENGVYDAIVRRAGSLAARWIHDDLPPMRRAIMHALPHALRGRAALLLARDVVRMTWGGSRVSIQWTRGVGTFTIRDSIFCDARGATPEPLCGFYAAAVEACFAMLGLDADVRIERCHARDGGACSIVVSPVAAGAGVRTVAMIALIAACAAPGGGAAQGPMPDGGDRALVMPFEHASRQPGLAWLAEGSSILLSDELRSAGVAAMTRDDRLRAFDRFQVPVRATLSRATVIRIGQLVGAADVVIGSIAQDQEAIVVKARRIRLDTGRLGPEVTVRGPLDGLAGVYWELAGRLWAGELDARPPAVAPGFTAAAVPLAAFEQYVKGLLAETPAAQAPFLARAIAIHPGYAEARIALAQSRTAAGDYRAAIDVLHPIPADSPRAADAGLLAAVAHLALRDYAAAHRILAGLQARSPSALVLNDLGVVRLRAASLPPGAGSATWYFSQARTLDPLEPDYLFNLGYAYWIEGDPHAAAYWLREAVRIGPTDAATHALLAQVQQAAGQPADAGRELALAQRLSSSFGNIDLKTGQTPAPPRGLERLKDTLEPPRSQRLDAALEMVGQREQRELAASYLERGRLAYDKENDHEAEIELTRAIYLSPYEAGAHLLLGRVYLRTGRLREAIDTLKVSIWSEETAAARVALAEAYLEARDPAAAEAEAARALALDPRSLHAQQLLDRLRRPSSAPV